MAPISFNVDIEDPVQEDLLLVIRGVGSWWAEWSIARPLFHLPFIEKKIFLPISY